MTSNDQERLNHLLHEYLPSLTEEELKKRFETLMNYANIWGIEKTNLRIVCFREIPIKICLECKELDKTVYMLTDAGIEARNLL